MHSDDVVLIDRQVALAEIDANIVESIPIPEDVYINKGLMIAKEIIEKLPTIEAEPVRHGRWENGECPNCKRNLLELCGGEDYELAMYAEFDADSCPFCGTRMDADEIVERRTAADDYAEY